MFYSYMYSFGSLILPYYLFEISNHLVIDIFLLYYVDEREVADIDGGITWTHG